MGEYTKSYLHSIEEDLELDHDMIVNWSTKRTTENDEQEKEQEVLEEERYNPKLYVKLIVNNKSKKILTNFFNEESNEEVDPLTLIDTKGLLTSALKLENVVINKRRIIIEVKMIESLFSKLPVYQHKQKEKKKRSLLRPGVEMKKAEVVKPNDTKHLLNDGIRNNNSFKLLEIDDE